MDKRSSRIRPCSLAHWMLNPHLAMRVQFFSDFARAPNGLYLARDITNTKYEVLPASSDKDAICLPSGPGVRF